MSIIRWDPFSELRQTVDRVLDESFRPFRFLTGVAELGEIPLDMYQTANDVVVKAALPGVQPEQVDITISGDLLTIKGETRVEEEIKREDYFRQERRYGAFSRSVTLPGSLKSEKAEASFENGILTLTIPKAEEAKPRAIKIKPKGVIEGKKG